MSRAYKVEIPFEVFADNSEGAAQQAVTDLLTMLPEGLEIHVTPVSDLITVQRKVEREPLEPTDMSYTRVTRVKETIFIPLPRELWRSCGPCACKYCGGDPGFWDTLALAKDEPKDRSRDWVHTVHYPELHKK